MPRDYTTQSFRQPSTVCYTNTGIPERLIACSCLTHLHDTLYLQQKKTIRRHADDDIKKTRWKKRKVLEKDYQLFVGDNILNRSRRVVKSEQAHPLGDGENHSLEAKNDRNRADKTEHIRSKVANPS
jgi:hypothetical protein